MLRLLLLSDIHFLSLYEEMDPNANLRKAFLKDLADYKEGNGKIDHILVCGDIAFKGAKEEYKAAHKFFAKLCEVVDCKPEEIYIVPGNHDKNFGADNAELRHLINAGLSNESIDSDRLFVELLDKNFCQFRTLYQPFKNYQDFAVKMVSTEPLMTKCLDETDDMSYDNQKDKAYMMARLGEIGDYPVTLYAMNTSLCSDWNDYDDFEKGHKLFLSKLSYQTNAEKEGNINIAMMHHPVNRLVYGELIANVLDENFQIQIFGHLHKPVSNKNGAIHIHSGALQPQQNENDMSDGYFSVYNILELDVESEAGMDKLSVQLRVEQFDKNQKVFKGVGEESKHFILPLKKHVNRWIKGEQPQPEALPVGVTERTVKYRFLQLNNPKAIMERMLYSYDWDKSHNKNCLDFLNKVQAEHRMSDLWNEINKE